MGTSFAQMSPHLRIEVGSRLPARSDCSLEQRGRTGNGRPFSFVAELLFLALVLDSVLVEGEAIDGVSGGIAEELNLRVDDLEEELRFGFREEIESGLAG
jgi:hypothetical protein